jgi:hypothetical protein
MTYPIITFTVKTYDLSEILASTPVEDLENRLAQLNARTIQIPGHNGNLRHGDSVTLSGLHAQYIRDEYADQFEIVEITSHDPEPEEPEEVVDLLSGLTAFYTNSKTDIVNGYNIGGLALAKTTGLSGVSNAAAILNRDGFYYDELGIFPEHSLSLSFFFKKDVDSFNFLTIGTDFDDTLYSSLSSGVLTVYYFTLSSVIDVSSSVGDFVHVVMIYNDETASLSIYIDGVLGDTQTFDPATPRLPIFTQFSVQISNGVVQNLGIWNRVVNSAEVLALFNEGAGVVPVV